MSKRKNDRIKVSKGFRDESGAENITSSISEYIKKQDWNQAINSFSNSRPKSKLKLQERIEQTFNEALMLGLQGKDFLSLERHCELLALDPNHLAGLRNFAVLLKRRGQYKDSLFYIQKYLSIKEDCPDGLNTLGTILNDMGENDQAMIVLKKAYSLNPLSSNINNNLANQYHLKAQIDMAFIHSTRAIKQDPKNSVLWLDHMTHLKRVCSYSRLEKVDWWSLMQETPANYISTSFLQLLTISETEQEQEILLKTIKRWGDTQIEQANEHPIQDLPRLSLDCQAKLNIGFLSADFRDHSVARFIWPLFEHLNRKEFSLHCYSTFKVKDNWRKKFEKSADSIRDINDLSPQKLAELIQRDCIHVLFDLTGFTNGSRTGSLAWRAAPAQVSWLGFPGTSGLKTMDYLFLDKYLSPKNPEYITEKVLESNGTTVCFSDIAEIPITKLIPEKQRGYLTFGSLNNTYKMTRANIQRWSSIMNEIPESQFMFVRREFESHFLRKNILKEFEEWGVNGDRVHFYNNRLSNRHYLDCYNEIDITLDTYPVTGGTTTTDALWMGVPVVGLEGSNIHQRVCSAILRHAGHPEWIAQSNREFKEIALNLAKNQTLRIELRETLRDELKQSILCDTVKFAEDFSDSMRTIKSSLLQEKQ